MRIYTKCPCCGRTIFLVMEMELGSSFGKDYKQNLSQDWNCLNNFLNCLQSSQGERVYLGVSEKEEGKIPEEAKEMIMNWTEKGYKKPEEKKKSSGGSGGSNQNNQDSKDWGQIHPDFKDSSWNIEGWKKAGFNYSSCKEWIDIGLNVIDFGFAAWLKNTKRKTPDWVLNHGNMEKLKEEYESTLTYEI